MNYTRLGLVLGLVRHNKVVQQFTSRFGGLDQVVGEQDIGDFSTLAHHGQPDG